MALKILNVDQIKQPLTEAWQKFLNTTQDPANGQWYDTDPNGRGGLYGDLSDSGPASPSFDTSNVDYNPTQINVGRQIVDNRNGLTPSSEVTLSHEYANSFSYTQDITNMVNVGVTSSIGVEEDLITLKGSTSLSYEWSLTNSSGTTTTDTYTFSEVVPINVPEGKVYEAVLIANKANLTVPYSAAISVFGVSNAWFENPIDPAGYHWIRTSGQIFSLINQFNTAGDDSSNFQQTDSGAEYIIRGSVEGVIMDTFTVSIQDITDQYENLNTIAVAIPSSGSNGNATASPPAAKIVATYNYPAVSTKK